MNDYEKKAQDYPYTLVYEVRGQVKVALATVMTSTPDDIDAALEKVMYRKHQDVTPMFFGRGNPAWSGVELQPVKPQRSWTVGS